MNDLSAVLPANGPHASLGDQAHVFDRFVGAWDCHYTHLAEGGSVTEEYDGRVTFGWIIDGWAMQDVWSGGGSIGTSIRWFDPKKGVWMVMWFAPEGAVVTRVEGGAVGDRIVLQGENQDGSLRRWSFNEIRPDSFVWRGERSSDRGATWRLEAEYHTTRRARRSRRPRPRHEVRTRTRHRCACRLMAFEKRRRIEDVAGNEIDAYLDALEEPKRSTLARLRDTIMSIVPDAEQCISYGMPAFRLRGKVVAGFAAFKNHLSYLPHSGSVIPHLGADLEGYTYTNGSLHFPVHKPLPKALVRKLLTIRIAEASAGR